MFSCSPDSPGTLYPKNLEDRLGKLMGASRSLLHPSMPKQPNRIIESCEIVESQRTKRRNQVTIYHRRRPHQTPSAQIITTEVTRGQRPGKSSNPIPPIQIAWLLMSRCQYDPTGSDHHTDFFSTTRHRAKGR